VNKFNREGFIGLFVLNWLATSALGNCSWNSYRSAKAVASFTSTFVNTAILAIIASYLIS